MRFVHYCQVLVYDYPGSKYVVDGHKRTCKALLRGIDGVKAITFALHNCNGLIRVGEHVGYNSFDENTVKPVKI